MSWGSPPSGPSRRARASSAGPVGRHGRIGQGAVHGEALGVAATGGHLPQRVGRIARQEVIDVRAVGRPAHVLLPRPVVVARDLLLVVAVGVGDVDVPDVTFRARVHDAPQHFGGVGGTGRRGKGVARHGGRAGAARRGRRRPMQAGTAPGHDDARGQGGGRQPETPSHAGRSLGVSGIRHAARVRGHGSWGGDHSAPGG